MVIIKLLELQCRILFINNASGNNTFFTLSYNVVLYHFFPQFCCIFLLSFECTYYDILLISLVVTNGLGRH